MRYHGHAARAILAGILAFAAFMSVAQAPQTDPAAIQAVIEEAKSRLKLTPEQETQLRPMVLDRKQKLKVIRDKYAGDRSRRAKRAMFKEAQPVVENYQARVRTILDDQQKMEWEKMRAEEKERLKEQYKSGNGPN
jgi:ribosomal protein S12 methylthiotransferase accessory factor YcaO